MTAVDASAKSVSTISLQANAPIASVTVAGRTIMVAVPRDEIGIELPPGTTGPTVIDVVSSTRQKAQVTVEAGATSARVEFGAAPAAGQGRAGRPPATGGTKPGTAAGKKGSTKGPKLGDYPGSK